MAYRKWQPPAPPRQPIRNVHAALPRQNRQYVAGIGWADGSGKPVVPADVMQASVAKARGIEPVVVNRADKPKVAVKDQGRLATDKDLEVNRAVNGGVSATLSALPLWVKAVGLYVAWKALT